MPALQTGERVGTGNRILIAEDHPLVRGGLKALLEKEMGMNVIGEADNGEEAVTIYRDTGADLIIMDISMPRMDGVTAISAIKKINPEARILALTAHKSEEYIYAVFGAGAEGFVLKDADNAEIKLAVKMVMEGKTYLSPSVSGNVVQGYLHARRTGDAISPYEHLTGQEKRVFRLVVEGRKNREISEIMHISIKTVEKHRTNLMKKLGVHSAYELCAFAREMGL